MAGLTSTHLIVCEHPRPQHAGTVAGHVVGKIAVTDQMLGHDRVTILFRDSAKEKPVLASLGAGGSQPAIEPVRIDQCLSSNQRRAAVPDEVASQDPFQYVTFLIGLPPRQR